VSLIRRAVKRLLGEPPSKARRRLEEQAVLLGQLHAERVRGLPPGSPLGDAEFHVFSQFGEDGIIQYLIANVPTPNPFFVEFGVEDYAEANTRFLVLKDNWAGLIMDGSSANVAAIKADDIYWRHQLTAIDAFITRENVNELISANVDDKDIGLLSIDIDGNDYWVWEATDCISPRIVVVEYNSVFGSSRAITIPYSSNFRRTEAHHSNLYWGASLAALAALATRKGYVLAGCNSAGNNAFFVRGDVADYVPRPTVSEAYVESKFRESRDERGQLTLLSGAARLDAIGHLPVVDVVSGETHALSQLP
jgi:hypothetical protein